jgi:hypothetical protein
MFSKIILLTALIFVFGYWIFAIFRIISTDAPDFSVYYHATADVVKSINPYKDKLLSTGFGYPPFTILFYLPLMFFSYPAALSIWIIGSALSLGLIIWLTLKLIVIKHKQTEFFIWLGLMTLFFPTKFTLGMGQSNLVAMFFLVLGIYLVNLDRERFAGLSLGIALIIKPHFILLITLLICFRKYKTLATTLIIIVIAIMITGFGFGWKLYPKYITEMAIPLSIFKERGIYYNQGLAAFFSRLTTNILASWLTVFTSILFYCLSLYLSLKDRFKIKSILIFGLPVLLLIEPLSWQHHFVFLIPAYIILWHDIVGKPKLQVLLLLSFLLVGFNIKNPEIIQNISFSKTFLSHVFWGNILLLSIGIINLSKST